MTVYGSDPLAYDFEAALAASRERAARVKARAVQRDLDDEVTYWRNLPMPAPSRAELLRHLSSPQLTKGQTTVQKADTRRAVEEVAAVYGISFDEAPKSLESVRRRASRRATKRPHEHKGGSADMTSEAA